MTQNSGRGAVWEGRWGGGGGREGDHMCCAKSTVNTLLDGAFTREQLSTCMRTKVTVEMYVYVE